MQYINRYRVRDAIRHHLPALNAAHDAVMQEPDPARRALLIERNSGCWRALRDDLGRISAGKCWYIECRNPGTDNDVDHFRPKGAIFEEEGHPGYYWLAFQWHNFRYSCHRANRARRNPETGGTGGKGRHFPLLLGGRRAWCSTDSLEDEMPMLLDPTDPGDVRMVSFLPSGEADLAPELKGNVGAEERFRISKLYLHFDWPAFREARLALFNRIDRLVDQADRLAPPMGSTHAKQSFQDILGEIIELTRAESEYSSAALAYVRLFRHIWWIDQVVLQVIAA